MNISSCSSPLSSEKVDFNSGGCGCVLITFSGLVRTSLLFIALYCGISVYGYTKGLGRKGLGTATIAKAPPSVVSRTRSSK